MKKVDTSELNPDTETGIEKFLFQAKEYIGKIGYTPDGKYLDKDSFVRIFKYTGDFSKWKNTENRMKGQDRRIKSLGTKVR